MTRERWNRIQELYHTARGIAESDRARFLASACAGDAVLQREVQALLDQPVSTGGFMNFVGGPPSARLNDVVTRDLTGRQIGSFRAVSPPGRGGKGDGYPAHH